MSDLKLAVAAGLILALALFSSIVAWLLGHQAILGEPLHGWFYNPLAVVGWAWRWGWSPVFLDAAKWAAGIALLPPVVSFMADNGKLRGSADGDGLGTARDLLKAKSISTRGNGVVLGRSGFSILRDNGDGHVAAFGPSRSGKGAGVVVPTLLTHAGAMLVFDPKNELVQITGRLRREIGLVHTFNPTKSKTARFNPLLELGSGQALPGNCDMAAALIADGGKGFGPKDPFWENSNAYLLSGLIFHACTSDDPTLGHVWRLLQDMDNGRWPENPKAHAAKILDGVMRKPDKQREGIIGTAISSLKFMNDPVVRHAVGGSDFRASDLQAAKQPVSVFISIPAAHGQRLRGLTRLVLQAMLKPLLFSPTFTQDGKKKKRPVLALLDEFPQLGYMDTIENDIPISAGYGVRFCLIAQDPDQIERHYGERQSITANCTTHVVIPGFSGKALNTVARWAGEHVITRRSRSRPHLFGGGSASTSESETRAPVLDPGEMIRRSEKEVLVFTLGKRPTYLKKVRYWKERTFRGRFDQPGEETWTPPAPMVEETLPAHDTGMSLKLTAAEAAAVRKAAEAHKMAPHDWTREALKSMLDEAGKASG